MSEDVKEDVLASVLWECVTAELLEALGGADRRKKGVEAGRFVRIVQAAILRSAGGTPSTKRAVEGWRAAPGALEAALRRRFDYGEVLCADSLLAHAGQPPAVDLRRTEHFERVAGPPAPPQPGAASGPTRALPGSAAPRPGAAAPPGGESRVKLLAGIGDHWGLYLTVSQAGQVLRHPRDWSVVRVLPKVTALPCLDAVGVSASAVAVAYPDQSIRFVSFVEKSVEARVRAVYQAGAPQPALAYSSKHDKLLSGGVSGDMSLWHVPAASSLNDILEVTPEELLRADHLVRTESVCPNMLAAGGALSARAARDLHRVLRIFGPLFGLTPGQVAWLVGGAQSAAPKYLAALAQVRAYKPPAFARVIQQAIHFADFELDGNAVGGRAESARDGSPLCWRMRPHKAGVTALVIDGKGRVVSASKDCAVAITDVELQKTLYKLQGRGRGILAIDVSRESHVLAAAGYDATPMVWDLQNPVDRPQLLLDPFRPHTGRVVSVLCSQSLPQIVTADCNGLVKVWDTRMIDDSKGAVQTFSTSQHGHADRSGGPVIADMAFHPLKTTLVVVGREVAFFKARAQNPYSAGDSAVTAVVHKPALNCVVMAGGNVVAIWDAVTGCRLRATDVAGPDECITGMCAFTQSPNVVISVSTREMVQVRVSTGDVLKRIPIEFDGAAAGDAVVSLVVVPRPQLRPVVVAVMRQGSCMVYTTDLRPRSRAVINKTVVLSCACWCPSIGLLAVGNTSGAVLLLDPLSTKPDVVQQKLSASFGEVCCVCSLAHVQCLATSDASGGISLWDLKPHTASSFQLLSRWPGIGKHNTVPVLTSSGKYLFAGDDAGVVRLWDITPPRDEAEAEPFELVWTSAVHKSEVTAMCLATSDPEGGAPSGRRAAAGATGPTGKIRKRRPEAAAERRQDAAWAHFAGLGAAARLLTAGADNRAAVVCCATGGVAARFLQGRGVSSTAWTAGDPAPYTPVAHAAEPAAGPPQTPTDDGSEVGDSTASDESRSCSEPRVERRPEPAAKRPSSGKRQRSCKGSVVARQRAVSVLLNAEKSCRHTSVPTPQGSLRLRHASNGGRTASSLSSRSLVFRAHPHRSVPKVKLCRRQPPPPYRPSPSPNPNSTPTPPVPFLINMPNRPFSVEPAASEHSSTNQLVYRTRHDLPIHNTRFECSPRGQFRDAQEADDEEVRTIMTSTRRLDPTMPRGDRRDARPHSAMCRRKQGIPHAEDRAREGRLGDRCGHDGGGAAPPPPRPASAGLRAPPAWTESAQPPPAPAPPPAGAHESPHGRPHGGSCQAFALLSTRLRKGRACTPAQ
ncbi:Vegetative incompatibility protein HET-E-1 [Diplonema papillatum]|nr:Vegetative incompatibility protein HET-E-1 [Diplonema papillatum]